MSNATPSSGPDEFELISRLKAKLPTGDSVVVGAGDDCAVIDAGVPGKWQLHKTDAVVEGVHFTKDADPRQIGHKALGRALSDIAAMAGTPRWATVTLGLPDGFDAERVESIYDGMAALAKRHDVSLVGGETVANPERLFIGVSLVGEIARDKCILRSGASVGDGVWVTGEVGRLDRRASHSFYAALGRGALACGPLPAKRDDRLERRLGRRPWPSAH